MLGCCYAGCFVRYIWVELFLLLPVLSGAYSILHGVLVLAMVEFRWRLGGNVHASMEVGSHFCLLGPVPLVIKQFGTIIESLHLL